MSKLPKIAIASDHAGFELKEILKTFLGSRYDILDFGTHGLEPVDYPDYAQLLGQAILEHRVSKGILLCGSGVGASIAANKLVGIRAAVCHDTYSAHQGVEHDHMNILALGARIIGVELAKELVIAFLRAEPSKDPRHLKRLQKIAHLENK